MRRRPSLPVPRCRLASLVARVGSVAVGVGLAGCHLPTTDYQQPLPKGMRAEPLSVYPPSRPAGPVVKPTIYAPGTFVPLVSPAAGTVPATPSEWKGIARGASPSFPDRLDFPDPLPRGAFLPADTLPPPAALAPEALLVRPTARRAPEPSWVAAGDTRISRTVVPGEAPPVRDEGPAAAKPAPPEADDAGPKPAPPDETASKPAPVATPPVSAPKPAPPEPAVPVPVAPPELPPTTRESFAPVPPRPAPAIPRRPETHDGVVNVGGVPVPVPNDALKPNAPVTAAAAQPPTMLPPPVLPVAPTPVTTEPPIRPQAAPRALPPLVELPPIPTAQLPPAPPAKLPVVPLPAVPTPAPLPLPSPVPGAPVAGPIDVNGVPLPFDSLSQLIDGGSGGGSCPTCGGGCGPGQCRAGKKQCEPFPARTVIGRMIGMTYENICCVDPCYQPRWEALPSAAFFTDSPRPVTQTRARWDYGERFTFPDRGEYFWARADGKGKGPKPNAPALGTPALDYHELYLDQEIAAGMGSVTVSMPYRSVNPTPFTNSAAGFGDLQITAKSLLYDTELFMFAFQFKTYIPTGQAMKGLGTGHTSLEPGLIAGLRISPRTYAQAQVREWIPIAGDKDYMGAAIFYSFSLNHILWQPVRDVRLIGTWETTGFGFQDGLYTNAAVGGIKLSGQSAVHTGVGLRLFFCDTLDLGLGWQHGISGKYLIQDQVRTEFRYRF